MKPSTLCLVLYVVCVLCGVIAVLWILNRVRASRSEERKKERKRERAHFLRGPITEKRG